MDCREEYESFKLDTSIDRARLLGFHARCCLEAPDLAQKAKERSDELEGIMEQEWAEACAIDKAKAYKSFAKRWPATAYAEEAEKEIAKRYEFYTALINKEDKDGNLQVRWPILVILAPVCLLAIGIGCLLLLGLTAFGLSLIGLSPDYMTAAPVLAVAVLLIVKFGFNAESSSAFMSAIFVSVFPALTLIFLGWIGLGGLVSGFYQVTGL